MKSSNTYLSIDTGCGSGRCLAGRDRACKWTFVLPAPLRRGIEIHAKHAGSSAAICSCSQVEHISHHPRRQLVPSISRLPPSLATVSAAPHGVRYPWPPSRSTAFRSSPWTSPLPATTVRPAPHRTTTQHGSQATRPRPPSRLHSERRSRRHVPLRQPPEASPQAQPVCREPGGYGMGGAECTVALWARCGDKECGDMCEYTGALKDYSNKTLAKKKWVMALVGAYN